MNRIPWIVSPLLILVPAIAQGQTLPAYDWIADEGGLVDQQTGLVWGFGPTNILDETYTYFYMMDHAGDDYAATDWGYDYTDWRVPTKAELLDAVDKDVYLELSYYAALFGLHQPYPNGYWAADMPFRQKGSWYGYFVRLDNGAVSLGSVKFKNPYYAGSSGRAIVVRQASGN